MIKNIAYNLTIFLALGMVLSSCKKDSTQIEESVSKNPLSENWQLDQRFQDVPIPFEGIRLNLFATDEYLFLHGPNRFDRVDLNGNAQSNRVFNENTIKFPVNEALHFDYDVNKSFAFKANDPGDYSVAGGFIIDIDSTLIDLKIPASQRESLGAISSSNHALIPLHSQEGIKILLLRIDGNGKTCTDCSFKIGYTKTISLIDLGGATKMHSPSSIKDYFFIPTSNGVYKLDTIGNHQNVLNDSEIKTIFDAGEFIGACGDNGTAYVSYDYGESWQSTSNFPIPLRNAQYQLIGDSLVAYTNKLFTLNLSEGQWRTRALKIDPIMNPYIASVAKFNDTIFIATFNGVYKKSSRSFYH